MANLDDTNIRLGLARTGEKLQSLGRGVDILIVGGAAGMLTGELSGAWTTADVDTIDCQLPQDREAVLDAAAEAGRELMLPSDWLNDLSGLYSWTLPDGWESRRVPVGVYDSLRVHAVGRIDLIRMKFVAHRERDIEHLTQMNVRPDELDSVRGYLDVLTGRYPEGRFPREAHRISMARLYVDEWNVRR